jgi:hypothetical protein
VVFPRCLPFPAHPGQGHVIHKKHTPNNQF